LLRRPSLSSGQWLLVSVEFVSKESAQSGQTSRQYPYCVAQYYGGDGLLCSLGERLDAWRCYRAPLSVEVLCGPRHSYRCLQIRTDRSDGGGAQANQSIRAGCDGQQLRLEFLQAVQIEPVIKEGQVAPELLKLVAERNIGLLVIGTRGHHGLDRLLQGSIAEEVFRQAPCPVLIVPPTASEQSGIPVRTILYPTSFSENSLRAAPYAFSLARRHRARLILLHVSAESSINSQDDLVRLQAAGKERLRQLLPTKGWTQPRTHGLCIFRSSREENCSSCRGE